MARKLASVETVWKLEPIEGADKIELAHVLGWQCVVKKGEIREMENAVYFEIDSFLPIEERYEFLRASSYKKTDIMGEGFRLRTQKFKGQISQGLLLPLSMFPELDQDTPKGTAVAEQLGVRKWEIEERATTGGNVIGNLPPTVPHTDETRVQAEPGLIEEFGKLEYYISTKMDGSSHSIALDDEGFHVTGHNYEYKDDGSCSFYEFVKKNDLRWKLERLREAFGCSTLTVQGEYCGPGIQGNRLKLTKPNWYIFTVIVNGNRMGIDHLMTAATFLGINPVPIEEIETNLALHYPTVEALLERADGEYENGGKKEGIVIRPTVPVKSRITGEYLSMKVVSNKYLLKNE